MQATGTSVVGHWKRALSTVNSAWRPLLAFDLVFRGIMVLALAPGAAWLVTRLVRGSGASAVGNADIVGFLLSWRGLATLIVGSALALALQLLEDAGLIHLVARRQAGIVKGLGSSLWAAARVLPRALHLAGGLTLRLLLVAAPFIAALAGVYVVFLTEHDINAYLHDKPPALWTALGIGAVISLIAVFVLASLWVRWSLSLPIVLEEGLNARAAMAESARRTKGVRLRVGSVLMGWTILASLGTSLVLLGFDRGGRALLNILPEETSSVLPALAALLLVRLVIGVAATFLLHACRAALQFDLHVERGGKVPARPEEIEAAPLVTKRLVRIAAIAALLAAGAGAAGVYIVGRTKLHRKVAIIAHRGASRNAPENSASAVKLALEEGATWAEIDVQPTKDGVVVLVHDADLQRLAGMPLRIAESTAEELAKADIGSRFSSKFAGERVARLGDLMDEYRGRIGFHVELKFYGRDRRLIADVVNLVKEKDFEKDCVIASLDVPSVIAARKIDPKLRTAAIVSLSVGDLLSLDVDILSLRADLATDGLIRAAHRRGKEVYVWTVNDPHAMSDWIDRGVDGILTDDPVTLSRIVKEREDLSEPERLLLLARSLFR